MGERQDARSRCVLLLFGGIRRRKREGGGSGAESVSGKRSSPKEMGKYIGQFRQSLRNGRGVYTLPNRSFYDGEFWENIQNGYGIFHWPDGSIYEGQWQNGKRHGPHGILVASDGFRYEGSWVNNTMEGRGVATYPKGQVYNGTWVGGRREGRGTTNGSVYEGRFKDDYMEGQGTMKMDLNVIIPTIASTNEDEKQPNGNETNDPAVPVPPSTTTDNTVVMKHDWMIPLQFQTDISHIHQKAGFTQIGF